MKSVKHIFSFNFELIDMKGLGIKKFLLLDPDCWRSKFRIKSRCMGKISANWGTKGFVLVVMGAREA